MKTLRAVLVAVCIVCTSTIQAQSLPDSSIIIVKTKWSGSIEGRIISETRNNLKLESENFGIITISKKEIINKFEVYSNRIVGIKTSDKSYYVGKLISNELDVVIIETENLTKTTISKKDILDIDGVNLVVNTKKSNLKNVGKNATYLGLAGVAPLLGITYERLISKNLGIEIGAGFIGGGLGVKVYPFGIKNDKAYFHSGVVGFVAFAGMGFVGGGYIPFGLTYFHKKKLTYGFDLGPGIVSDSRVIPYGSMKIGFRF